MPRQGDAERVGAPGEIGRQVHGPGSGHAWIVFATLAFAYFMTFFFRVSIGVMVPDLMRDFGVSAGQVSLLVSAYFVTCAIGNLFVGGLCDRYGPRFTSSAFLMLATGGALCFSLSGNYTSALISRAILGFGVAGVYIPTLKALAELFASTRFATLTGLLISIGNLGGIFGTSILSLLVLHLGWRASIGLAGALTFASGVLCWLLVKGRPRDKRGRGYSSGRPVGRPSRGSWLRSLVCIMTNRDIVFVSIIGLIRWGATMAFQTTWGGLYLIGPCGLSKVQAGNILAMVSVGYIAGAPLAGYLSDQVFHARKSVLLATQAVYAAAWLPLALCPHGLAQSVLYGCVFLIGVGGGAGVAISFSLAKEAVEAGAVSVATAVMNVLQMVGAALFQPVISLLVDTAGGGAMTPAAFGAAFRFCLVTVVLSSVLLRWVRETMP